MSELFSRHAVTRQSSSQRGASLLLFTIMLVTIVLPMVGLAIDESVAYLAQQRLIATTDAAALAGARSLNVGESISLQSANATAVAQRYFNANFPAGLLNSKNATAQITITPPTSANAYKTFVQVQSSASVGLYFLSLIGHPTSTLAASATTSRREVNVILALDRSGSMTGVCSVMKTDAENFANMFIDGRDAMGLVTFMGDANPTPDYQWTVSFKSQKPSLTGTLDTLNCGGNTGSASALSVAHTQIQLARTQRPWASNVIVFFTDGVPNGYRAGFPLQSGKSCSAAVKGIVAGYIQRDGGIDDTSTPPSITSTSVPVVTA